jgi:hypothetical protein
MFHIHRPPNLFNHLVMIVCVASQVAFAFRNQTTVLCIHHINFFVTFIMWKQGI